MNKPYSVDSEGYLRGKIERQKAEMEANALEDDAIEDELAEGEVNETLESAIDAAREYLGAEVEQQKAAARVKAQREDEVSDALRQEQEEDLQNGEFDRFDSVPDGLSRTSEDDDSEAGAVSASSKPKLKAKKNSYVRRGKKFVPATEAELIEGEKLYWFRKRKFGQAEKWIPFGQVERKEN